MTEPRFAVIGGGIVGVAAAAFLADAGARVVLYEREALAAGASGRNSGVVQQPFDLVLAGLYAETVEHYRRVNAETGLRAVAVDDAPAGLLLASHHASVVRALTADLAAAYPALGAAALDPDELARVQPGLAPDVWACRLELGFPVIPSAPTYAFATLAERLGVAIRLGRDARPAMERGDAATARCLGVEVGGTLERADAVVIAAGPWSCELVDLSGAWRPIWHLWGVVVDTLLAEPPRHVMEEAEMDEALGTGELAEHANAGATAREHGFSLISAGGVSAVGSTFLAEEPVPEAWLEPLLERAVTFVPAIAEAPIREVRACARPATPDGRPLVGAVPWVENLYVAAGHGPWGISTGPASARQVADLVLGREAGIDPACAVARFGRPASAVT